MYLHTNISNPLTLLQMLRFFLFVFLLLPAALAAGVVGWNDIQASFQLHNEAKPSTGVVLAPCSESGVRWSDVQASLRRHIVRLEAKPDSGNVTISAELCNPHNALFYISRLRVKLVPNADVASRRDFDICSVTGPNSCLVEYTAATASCINRSYEVTWPELNAAVSARSVAITADIMNVHRTKLNTLCIRTDL